LIEISLLSELFIEDNQVALSREVRVCQTEEKDLHDIAIIKKWLFGFQLHEFASQKVGFERSFNFQ
jgi:hypothetical protein